MKNNHYRFTLGIIFTLFFLWAISSNLLPTMIRQIMKTCELNPFEASFTESAYWIAYFIFPIPIAMFMKRWGYKAGIITGLFIAAAGGLLFIPASLLNSYGIYLSIFFMIATGMCCLETAANPYVSILGDSATATRRLNLAQSFNGLGAFVAAMFLSKFVLSGHQYTRNTLPTSWPGGWEGYISGEAAAMRVPYILLAVVLVVMALVIWAMHLPAVREDAGTTASGSDKLINFGVLRRSHLRWGVIAQFFYNGGQTAINSMFLVYCCIYAGVSEATATTLFGVYMFAFLLGRWTGTVLMIRFSPRHLLLLYAAVNVLLCFVITVCGGIIGIVAMIGVSFFMSVMYPTQFSLAIRDLGTDTKSGSAFLVMAIIGNACLPQLSAFIMNANPRMYHIAYLVPMICFAFCALYAWKKATIVD
jgi:FHS family L-fucose permease-like MFS transporter